ncbi:MAG: carboxypeptidase-like regulatory domain-containing protein, partial [Acidobacteriia bacterium]|nr:carboxypeptidase-like regulatory domain-containing protein [Terriglobia bacterium]
MSWGQTTSTGGSLTVTATDPSGAAVPGAALEVKDLSTNDIRRATTQANGVYTFLNLRGGTYSVTVSAQGFANQVFESVVIRTSLETEVKAALKLGATTESVTVTASEVPIVQTEASAIATNFDTKQVFNLPELGRSAWGLVYNVPGYASGTFNNLPGAAIVAADFDGVQSMSNRFREGGYAYGSSVIDPRMENIAEFTVTTSQLDLSGNGTSAMKISIVTKRGTNDYHGLLYEDFRNTVLNANSWSNNATTNAQGVGTARSITKLNNFGGSVGGPILKNKLFFFGTFSMQKNPNTTINSRTILNPLAQQGIYQYLGPNGAPVQVNLFQLAGIPVNKVNSVIGSQLSKINGITGGGLVTPSASDPNVSTYR